MPQELSKTYDPTAIEDRCAERWLADRIFEQRSTDPAADAAVSPTAAFTLLLPESVDFDSENPTVAAMNTIVYPGDIVRVSTAGVFYVIGEVTRQGIYPITGGITAGNGLIGLGKIRNMTLLQALTYAGGITSIAARSKAIVIRTKPDGSREIIHFDILKLEKGQIADPIIQPNDIIFVPSSYLRNITNNLFTSIINAAYILPIVTTTANNP